MSGDEDICVPAEITVRASLQTDVPAVTAIYAHHVSDGLASFEIVPPDEGEITRRRDETLARGLPHLVAARNGKVVGYAYAAPYRTRAAYRYTVEDSVYVDDRAVGHGAGRALLDALTAACTALGYRQMIAVIGDSANAASIRLHEACGFVRAGLLSSVGFKHGRWVDRDRKSTRLNSSHSQQSRMPSSA